MARSDLLALTDDGLTQLANAGLIKRGLRDLASGNGPILSEDEGGTIEARFADGTVTRLPIGRTPADAMCTCPAGGMCRHRVLLVLAYRTKEQSAPTVWDPATIDGAAYEAQLSPHARAELGQLSAARMVVRLERDGVPMARLPMASVRFLVPGEISYARCDCAETTGCAHIAIALRAFYEAAGAAEVTLGAVSAVAGAQDLAAAVDAVLVRLLAEGVVSGVSAHARGLERLLREARTAGATQLVLAIEQLGETIAAYEQRSARYDEQDVLALAAEMVARTRTSQAETALGIGQAMETAMAKTRLVSLGVRLEMRGAEMQARLLLADTDTMSTMLMERHFTLILPDKKLTETIGKRHLVPGVTLAALGRGQLLTSVARRRADGLLTLGSGSAGKTVLMPRAAIQTFQPPLAAASLDALLQSFGGRTISLLRPRNRVGDAHVFEVESVLGQAWAAGSQLWQAAVSLADDGGTLLLERQYDAAAPAALDILFAALAGERGRLRQVAGTVRVEGGALVCDPWSLTADELIVPDLETSEAVAEPIAIVDRARESSAPRLVRQFLASALHSGRSHRGVDFARRGAELAKTMRSAGYETTARRLMDWLEVGDGEAKAFGDVAVWVTTLLES
jgi:hypothetical protein